MNNFKPPPMCYPETRSCFNSVSIVYESINHVPILPPNQYHLHNLLLHPISHNHIFKCLVPTYLYSSERFQLPFTLVWYYSSFQTKQIATYHKALSISSSVCRTYQYIFLIGPCDFTKQYLITSIIALYYELVDEI